MLGKLSRLAIISSVAVMSTSWGATPQRLRGTVESVSSNALTIKSTDGKDIDVMLDARTKYAALTKASLDDVKKDTYIGTATKGTGNVALEVVIFPPSMSGHRRWSLFVGRNHRHDDFRR